MSCSCSCRLLSPPYGPVGPVNIITATGHWRPGEIRDQAPNITLAFISDSVDTFMGQNDSWDFYVQHLSIWSRPHHSYVFSQNQTKRAQKSKFVV